MIVTLARVSRISGATLHNVFKSKTTVSALKSLESFYAGQYAHDLDADRSQIPESYFRLAVEKNGTADSLTFSNRNMIDHETVMQYLRSMITGAA